MPRPTVYIPGLPGSHLFDTVDNRRIFANPRAIVEHRERTLERLQGPDDPDLEDGVVPRHPIVQVLRLLFLDFGKKAGSLYSILSSLGISRGRGNLSPVGWDWRLPLWHGGGEQRSVDLLEAGIRRQSSTHHNRRVVVIVHSTGGLIFRHLVETRPEIVNKIHHVIAFGVPWVGTLKSLNALAGNVGFPLINKARTREVYVKSHAAYDLLPPDPDRTDMTDIDGSKLNLFVNDDGEASPLIDQRWLPERFMRDRADRANHVLGRRARTIRTGGPKLKITNIAGWGYKTHVTSRLLHPGRWQDLEFNQNLNPRGEEVREGDGTIPFKSVRWLQSGDDTEVRTLYVPLGHYPKQQIAEKHSTLWRVRPAKRILKRILRGEQLDPNIEAATDHDDSVSVRPHIRVRMVAQQASGEPIQGATARFLGLSPAVNEDFSFRTDGRQIVKIPRSRIVQRIGNSLLRFQVRISYDDGSRRRHVTRTLLISRT